MSAWTLPLNSLLAGEMNKKEEVLGSEGCLPLSQEAREGVSVWRGCSSPPSLWLHDLMTCLIDPGGAPLCGADSGS